MCEIRSLKGHGAHVSISEVTRMSQVWHPKCLPGFMSAGLECPLAVRPACSCQVFVLIADDLQRTP